MTESDKILCKLVQGETIETLQRSLGIDQDLAQYMLDLAEELKREK